MDVQVYQIRKEATGNLGHNNLNTDYTSVSADICSTWGWKKFSKALHNFSPNRQAKNKTVEISYYLLWSVANISVAELRVKAFRPNP